MRTASEYNLTVGQGQSTAWQRRCKMGWKPAINPCARSNLPKSKGSATKRLGSGQARDCAERLVEPNGMFTAIRRKRVPRQMFG